MTATDLHSLFPLVKSQIHKMADSQSYTRGSSYQRGRMVLKGQLDVDAQELSGVVRGSSRPYYKVSVYLEEGRLSGTCSCPVGFACKHCVALCIEWLENPSKFTIIDKESEKRSKAEKPPLSTGQVKIPSDLLMEEFPETSEISAMLSLDDLQQFFTTAWKKVTSKDLNRYLADEDYLDTWNQLIDEIDFLDPPRGDYTLRDLDSTFNGYYNETPLHGWFKPTELIKFFSNLELKKCLAKCFFEDYVSLGTRIKMEFVKRGLYSADSKILLDHYKDVFDALIKKERESFTYGGGYGDDDYDDDYDEEEDEDDDFIDAELVAKFLDAFFKKIAIPLLEIGEYYTILASLGLDDHAKFLDKNALEWVNLVNFSFTDFPADKLPSWGTLKAMLEQKIHYSVVMTLPLEDRVKYHVKLLQDHPSDDVVTLLLDMIKDTHDTTQAALMFDQAFKIACKHKPDAITCRCWMLVTRQYLPDKIQDFLLDITAELANFQDFASFRLDFFGTMAQQPGNFISRLERDCLDGIFSLVESSKKSNARSKIQANQENSKVINESMEWFTNHHLQEGENKEAVDTLLYFAEKQPRLFTKKHYTKVLSIAKKGSVPKDDIRDALIKALKGKGQPEVILHLYIAEKMYDEAFNALAKFNDGHDILEYTNELLSKTTAVPVDAKTTLIGKIEKKVNSWVKEESRRRDDESISDGVLLLRKLFTIDKSSEGMASWEQWFKAFWKKNSRLHNLHHALQKKHVL